MGAAFVRRTAIFIMVVAFVPTPLVVGAGIVAAQDRVDASVGFGSDLDYGANGAGFTVLEKLDSTRAFRPLRDFRGRIAEEPARPIQVSVWYPTAVVTDTLSARVMRAGDFRLLRETEVDFDRELSEADRQRLRADYIDTATRFDVDPAVAAATWDDRLPVVRDAEPRPGPHPTVIYFTAAGVSNPVLPTYLASHGFVVASFPSNGRMTEVSLEFTPNALTLDTDVDDAGFVYGLLRRLPYADTNRLAVASFSSGSLATLLWLMRDMQAAAVVTMEGWERFRRGADIIASSVHYEPHRVRVPYLIIERAADEESPRYAKVPDVLGSMPYAEITRVAFRDAAHGDFLSHVSFGHTEHQPRTFETSARMVRAFLERTIGEGAHDGRGLTEREMPPPVAEMAPPADDLFFSVTRDAAIGPVPTEEELYRLAEIDPDSAEVVYDEATTVVSGSELFRESVLTRAAIFASVPEARATILRIVVDAYPSSTAARFRLGEALAEAGRAEEAETELQTALEIVAADPNLDEGDRAEWRERIRRALEELGVE